MRPGFWREVIGVLGALTLALLAVAMGLGQPSSESHEYRPTPDAVEYAWVARQFAGGASPLMPIVNDLHPSRYAPVHPWFMSIWVRLHGDNDRAMFTWPMTAWLGGLLFLYLWMAIVRLSLPARFAILALILFSPLPYQICQELLQEPTMFMLFWMMILSWQLSIMILHKSQSSQQRLLPILSKLILSGALAGAGVAALVLMRPTIAPLGLLVLVYLAMVGEMWKRIIALLAYLTSGLLVTVVVVVYNHTITGQYLLSTYYYWMPDIHTWIYDWGLLFTSDPQLHDIPRIDDLVRTFLGINSTLHPMGVVSGTLIFAGVLYHAAAWARALGAKLANSKAVPNAYSINAIALLLILFFVSQIIIHIAYKAWYPRFFVLIHSLWIVLGVVGIEKIVSSLRAKFPQYQSAVIVLTAALFILITGIYRYPLINVAIRDITQPDIKPEHRDAFARVHRFFTPLMKREAAPLFVDRLPVLNARLLLDLDVKSFPFPISQFEYQNDLYWDGHTVQFFMFKPLKVMGQLNPGAPWRSLPHLSYLVNLKQREIETEYFTGLLNHYGKIIIYINIYREHRLELLLDWARENGVKVQWRIEHDGWVMIVLTHADPPTVSNE